MQEFFSTVLNILIAVLVFGTLIVVHELGHFLAARWAKVPVRTFSIGMGPVIWRKKGKRTDFCLKVFPIGGSVELVGEDEESDDPEAFNRQPKYKRLIVLFAGALMNILLGLILSLVMVISAPQIGSNTIARFTDSALSGEKLMVGDTIKKIGGSPVFVNNDIGFLLMARGGETVDITVERDGEEITVEDVAFPMVTSGGTTAKARDFYVLAAPKTVGNVLYQGFFGGVSVIRTVWGTLGMLFTGGASVSDLSGPVGVTVAVGSAAKAGWDTLLYFVMFITINLGVVNLLPIPALDGGRILFIIIEAIRRKPLKPRTEGIIHFVGFVLLMILIVFVTFQDFFRLGEIKDAFS